MTKLMIDFYFELSIINYKIIVNFCLVQDAIYNKIKLMIESYNIKINIIFIFCIGKPNPPRRGRVF